MGKVSAPEIINIDARPYVAISASAPQAQLGQVIPETLAKVMVWLAEHPEADPVVPVVRYRRVDSPELEVDIGYIVSEPVAVDGDLITADLVGGRYASILFTGPYSQVRDGHMALHEWSAGQDLIPDISTDGVWTAMLEVYLTDPDAEPDPSRWQTEIMYRLRD